MSNQVLENLKILLQVPDLASKKWIYEQYDSQVMNDTIYTRGDAAIVRVHNTQKALAMTVDCTPRYVEADAFEGAKQAVAETYRNISAVGGKPLAITNCLNFGNPQKPEIMGQIVRAIQGITEACKALDYPVISGNVSLYNETDGKAIQPTPAIGGVGLLKDLHKRCDAKFKMIGDEIFVIGKTNGHISCSLFEREILKQEGKKNPPKVDLSEEKKNGEFVRELIESATINACHDVSDGGLLVSLFEMSNEKLGCDIDLAELKAIAAIDENEILFSEDQSRYVVTLDSAMVKEFKKKAEKKGISVFRIGTVAKEKIGFNQARVDVAELTKLNEMVFEKKFS
jgi:phosphoribosylformylglycinamidine (FGAM) synthase-like enzyme